MKTMADSTYNDRLFSGGLRARLHLARFHWLGASVTRFAPDYRSCLELGCYDARSIQHLPHRPQRYLGLDADWGDGIALARNRWSGEAGFEFRRCTRAEEMALAGERFDLGICLETLEHIPPERVESYLVVLADAVDWLFVSVPNEKGPVFAAKHLAKLAVVGDPEHYTLAEFINATLGRTGRVRRREHKGFDYARLIARLERHFEILAVTGQPLAGLPLWMNFGVGVVARARRAS